MYKYKLQPSQLPPSISVKFPILSLYIIEPIQSCLRLQKNSQTALNDDTKMDSGTVLGASGLFYDLLTRHPLGYTHHRLGIKGSMTSDPTRIAQLAVCCQDLLRLPIAPLTGKTLFSYRTTMTAISFLTALLEFNF
jgi:hypothetical protein